MTIQTIAKFVFAAGASFAQTSAQLPSFEVASVKPAAPSNLPDQAYRMTGGPGIAGQFTCTHISLKPLLLMAFDLKPYQLDGPPSITSDKYDIAAKVPAGTAEQQFKLMLQSLLVERLGLTVHKEARELPIYELVVARSGLKMKEAERAPAGAQTQPGPGVDGRPSGPRTTINKDGLPEFPPGVPGMFAMPVRATADGKGPNGTWVTARMQTIASLLNMLVYQIDRPVVDKTGLTGVYDFNLRYWTAPTGAAGAGSAEPPSSAPNAANDPEPSLFDAFERQLGLKFEPMKGPVKVLVVDKVNKTPTEN